MTAAEDHDQSRDRQFTDAAASVAPQLSFRTTTRHSAPSTPPQLGLTTVGLFAGIGGVELGLQKAGHSARLLCENDPGAGEVLTAHFSDAELREDIRDLRSLPKETELLAAGFPCQDLSQAGMATGITGSKSGLIGEVFRLLQRKRVPWVLLENVPFMLSLGQGRALDLIVTELEDMGYRWAYRTVDSRAFGLPQRRRRVFLLASREHDPREVLFADEAGAPMPEPPADEVACGFYWTEGTRGLGWSVDAIPTLKGGSTIGIPSPPAIWLPCGSIIRPDIRDAERLQGFRVGWTKPAERAGRPSFRWRLVGNAVSVKVAAWIGKRLAKPCHYDGTWDIPLHPDQRWPRAAWSLGNGRYVADVTEWPRHPNKPLNLREFLRYEGVPLSLKATSGFYDRARASSLRFPDGFLDAIGAHVIRMSQHSSDGVTKRKKTKPARRSRATQKI